MATNKVNGKSYIGKTINSLKQRKQEHIRRARNKTDNYYFHNSIKKHGPEAFEWIVLEECDDFSTLGKLEIYYIKLYKTFEEGMNLTPGGGDKGSLGFRHTEKTKRKMSVMQKGKNNPNYGKRGKETSMYGKHHSEEVKKKISDALKGRESSWKGKKHTRETLKKISGKNNHNSCAVMVDGKYFSTFISAAESLNVVQTTISNRVKRKVKGYVRI